MTKKKWLLIGIGVLVVVCVLFGIMMGDSDSEGKKVEEVDHGDAVATQVEATMQAMAVVEEVVTEEEVPTDDGVTLSQTQAVRKAESYLGYSAFSKSGLVKQLEFEGFSKEDSVYGVDNCGADWMEQASLKAESYLDYSAFSRSGLIEQLEFEGFTSEQAIYGVDSVGL